MDEWELDLLDLQAYAKYIFIYIYFLTVIDVFSKFLHMIPIKTKYGPSVAWAFRSIFDGPKYSKSRYRPICVRNDKGMEFLNKRFQDILRDVGEGIKFQVCRNPELKCAVVERVHRTIRDRLYKDFTYKNMYRYVFVKAYNDTVYSTTGMAHSRVTDLDVLAIWKKLEARRR